MRTIRLGSTTVTLEDSGLTVTRIDGLPDVPAWPQDTDEYRARAASLGYGNDLFRASREHEVLHSMAAVWFGQSFSRTLHGVATGKHWEHWTAEEAFILAAQRLSNILGVDVLELAQRLSEGRPQDETRAHAE